MSTIMSDEILASITLAPDQSVRYALRVICESGAQIAVVKDPDTDRMLATVTDGDIRRGLLQNASLEDPVSSVMNENFIWVKKGEVSVDEALATLRAKSIRQLPVLDSQGRLVALHTTTIVDPPEALDIPVVIMAGGLGRRLQPLTDDTPKPLLEIGGKPILERILINLITQGFRRFYFSVNYLAEQIENYFGDGSRWGADIRYVHERQRLGTAGALGGIEDEITGTIVVQNGDLITDFDYAQMIEAHRTAGAVATMGLRRVYTQIEFGVVDVQDGSIQSIIEKPTLDHMVNAGIYCLEAEIVNRIPANEYLDMPNLFTQLLKEQKTCHGFSIPKSWIDIGTHAELKRAQALFSD